VKLAGKTIVVVGGGNGIGREVVLELLRRDALVAAVDLRQESLDATSELAAAGDRLATYQLDITDRAAVESLPSEALTDLGRWMACSTSPASSSREEAVPGQTIYGASKAAVKLMTEGLYAEMLGTNVGVSVVMPGAVATDITANSGVASPGGAATEAAASTHRTTPADEAARIILDGVESDRFQVYVGRDASSTSKMSRLAPSARPT
jgi:NAD(P)-dependent dehydrogenase (short-subunit alcohol dehydrogenase family)